MSHLDAYDVAIARPPVPPEDPDPQALAYETQQALFAQEQAGSAWTAPLSPAREGRQRLPVPAESSGPPDGARGTERGAMCILGPDGAHKSPGLHCPHDLPAPGDPDVIVARIEF